MAGFAISSDPFRSCPSWDEAHRIAQGAGRQAIWAVVQFDALQAFFVVMSQALQGQNALSIHAEENVISNFETLLGRSTVYARTLMRVCNIYLSDSPCTTSEPHPSNSLQGYPPSCLAKLKVLARRFPLLQFNVYFQKTFRTLDEVTGSRHMGQVFIRLLDRLTPIFFAGRPAGVGSVILLQSLLSDFFPENVIGPDEVRAVLGALQRFAGDRAFTASLMTNPDASATVVGNAILKALAPPKQRGKEDKDPKDEKNQGEKKGDMKSSLRTGLANSILSRSIETDGVRNLTIVARSFDEDPPTP